MLGCGTNALDSASISDQPLSGTVEGKPFVIQATADAAPPPAAVAAIGNKRLLEGVVLAVVGGVLVLTLIGSFFRGKARGQG